MTVVSTVQTMEDGPRNLVVRLSATLQSTDAETAVTKITASSLSQWQGRACTRLSLVEFRSSTINASFKLISEGTLPTGNANLWIFPMNFSDHQKFKKIGGIQNNATNPTGNVLLTTENWGNPQLDGGYEIVLWFRKKYAA